MMHYRKGENVEKEITKNDLPFEDCLPTTGQTDFLWMHVKGGTKVSNVISYAKNALDKSEYRAVVWSGSGGGVVKTISCAEILKRDYPLYQVTRMCYTTVEEHWKPQIEGLEEIVANRQIPCIHILMSLDALDDSINGLQKPNTKTDFWVYSSGNSTSSASKPRRENTVRGGRQQHSGSRNSQRAPKTSEELREQQNGQNRPNRQENSNQNQKKSKSQNKPTPPQQQQQPQRQGSAVKSLNAVVSTEPMES